MSGEKMFNKKKHLLAVLIPVVIILLPIGYSVVSGVFARAPGTQPFLERPDAKYKNCVRDTEYMRFHHWELLKELRDETVRYRKRMDITMADCRRCHPNREHFCNRCHDTVNLKPDCWGCHYYPESPQAAADDVHTAATRSMPRRESDRPDNRRGR